MCYENIMKWKNKEKALKFLWNILHKNMKTYSVSCIKYTANENSSVRKTKQNRLILLSNCTISGKQK